MKWTDRAACAVTCIGLSALGFALPARGETLACGLVDQPAATLLLPYFEVDVADANGRTTLFSVGNTADVPTLAHAVVWTNWGHPVASFDFFVAAGGVQSINVRDILHGRLPETSPPALYGSDDYQSCATPLVMPDLDGEELIATLSGTPRAEDGLCYSAAVEEGRLVTGFITVDVVQDCSGDSLMTPQDAAYLGDCASGLAGNDNVLWGDFFLVDPSNDSAQGERLVSLVADQARFGESFLCVDPPCGARIGETFYAPPGNRMPLASAYETRFLNGGGFDGGTEFIVWIDGSVGPLACGDVPLPEASSVIEASFRRESGTDLGSQTLPYLGQSFRLKVGSDALPMTENFGSARLRAVVSVGGSVVGSRQLFVLPTMSASGRYSVGLTAAPIADACGL